MPVTILIRGGGDLASGTAYRLFRAGLNPIIAELPQPLAVRRLVSFAEAVYTGYVLVEGVTGRKARNLSQAWEIIQQGELPVLVDPQAASLQRLKNRGFSGQKIILIDARMLKNLQPPDRPDVDLVIGLGPGFTAGQNCDAVIETRRGHFLGRIIWQGVAESDTGVPDSVAGYESERVLRAPVDGFLVGQVELGDSLEKGQPIALVNGVEVRAPFRGVLRGLLHPGLMVDKDMKIGDIDPRNDARFCKMVSDKSLAIGGGVLEAILSRTDLRPSLWG